MADQTMAERFVGERIGGRFVIERLIGEGSLSSAFRARDELLRRRVTVKLFHPQHADDLAVIDHQLELAKSVARLSHQNIAVVIDRGEHDGMPFLVLEFVRGESLQERMDRFAPLPVDEVVAYGVTVSRALAYAHAQGVVHGNVRPGNILLTEEREAKLVDFGRGSFLAALSGDPYLPPEEVTEQASDPTPEGDVFAVGALLFAALTDARPVVNVDAVRVQMLRPDASAQLAGIVARALAGDRTERHGSMRELASDLASLRPSRTPGPDSRASGVDMSPMRVAGPELTAEISIGGSDFDHLDPLAPPPSAAAGNAAERGRRRRRSSPRDAAESRERRPERAPRPVQSPAPARAREAAARSASTGAVRDARASVAHNEPGAFHDQEREGQYPQFGSRSRRRSRIIAWSLVVIPIIALVVIALMLGGERGHGQRTAKRTTTSATRDAPLVGATVSTLSTYDPDGDGTEHQDTVDNLIDGDPSTRWTTESYGSSNFGNTKSGAGFYVQLTDPEDLTATSFTTDLPGWTVQVYAADVAGKTLADWTPVSRATQVTSGSTISVDTKGQSYPLYLYWISRLSLDPNNPSAFTARASELRMRVVGPAAGTSTDSATSATTDGDTAVGATTAG